MQSAVIRSAGLALPHVSDPGRGISGWWWGGVITICEGGVGWRPHGARAEQPRSRCGGWVEPIDELDERVLEAELIVVGVFPDERDHLPIAVGSLAVFAAGLVDHAEAIVAIVHVGKQHQKVAGGLFSLVELAGSDQVGSGVGCDCQVVLVG